MRSLGIDVGRHSDDTVGCVLDDNEIAQMATPGPVSFRQQAQILAPIIGTCHSSLIDVTGLGIGLYELLHEMVGQRIVPVTLIYGDRLAIKNGRIVCGKAYLASVLTTNIREIKARLPPEQSKKLKTQLSNFVITVGKRPKFHAASGKDDNVVALGLALIGAQLSGQRQAA